MISGLIISNLIQAVYIYYLDNLDGNQVSETDNKIVYLTAESVGSSVEKEGSDAPAFSAPLCDISVHDIFLKDNEYMALLSHNGNFVELNKGQFVNNTVSVYSVTPQGVILQYSDFRQFLPYEFSSINLEEGAEEWIRANEGFPDAEPVKGFFAKSIPAQYQPDISILSDNVLVVRRHLFNGFLESEESLKSINFAVSSKGGFQATNVAQDSLFSGLGLETGDIVKAVNNKDIRTALDAVEAYKQLNEIDLLELRLERQGQEISYFYQLID